MESRNGPGIDVAIITGTGQVSLSGVALKTLAKGKEIAHGPDSISIYYNPDGILVDDILLKTDKLDFYGKDLKVNGRPYRGMISLFREEGALTVVNSLGLESYLMGIINHEISSQWPIESVKAQAVAARSYAYNKLESNKEGPYHLKSTVDDQVYGGSLTEDERGNRAVNETRGEVLFYEGKVAQTLYHSSCGGHTERANDVWDKDFPYLNSVEDTYCTDAPNYFWLYRADFDSILLSLKNSGYSPSKGPRRIKVLQRSATGRIKKVEVAGIEITGNLFRKVIGYDKLRSTLFTMEMDGNEIIFSGSGSGHGVGMCQWGAKGRAGAGKSYKEILRYYYEGAKVRKIY